MSDLDAMRPLKESRSRPLPVRRHNPAVERLDRRTLLSYGGTPDFTFGVDGIAPLSSTLAGQVQFSPTASAQQPDGKLVVIGVETETSGSAAFPARVGFDAARYNTDGTVDPTFDDTTLFDDGSLITAVGGVPALPGYARPTGVAIQADGKIVIVGDIDNVVEVVRLNADGTLDMGFGDGGIVTLGKAATDDSLLDYASAVAILPGGQIAVAGASTPTTGDDTPAVEVLQADGAIDTGYGSNGLALAAAPLGIAGFFPITPILQTGSETYSSPGPVTLVAGSDGSITLGTNGAIAGNINDSEIVLARFTPTGLPDPTFGNAGQATIAPQIPLDSGVSDLVTALALQPDGELIAGGSIVYAGESHAMIVRLEADGSLDTAFGIGGFNILGYTTPLDSSPAAIALQDDGRIVIADEFMSDFERLNPNGLPDHSFGVHGTTDYVNPQDQDRLSGGAVGIAVQADGKLIVTEADGTLMRLLGQGSSGDYNDDGISDPAIYDTASATFADESSSGPAAPLVQFGIRGEGNSLPAPGAYFGNGEDDIAVYLPNRGAFAVREPDGVDSAFVPFGTPGVGNSLPASGDFDGSGITEYAVYLPASGEYVYRPTVGGTDTAIKIGLPGPGKSIPAPADYFGTARDDIAVYEPSLGDYVIRNSLTDQTLTIPFGSPNQGDIPVPGDYDGSGHAELAIYIPAFAELIYRPASGAPDVTIPFGMPGIGNTLPAPGDYDGSGKTDVAAYLPTLGVFAYRPADGGPDVYLPIGAPEQTIPFIPSASAEAGDSGSGSGGSSGQTWATSPRNVVEIPLPPDLIEKLDGIAPNNAKPA